MALRPFHPAKAYFKVSQFGRENLSISLLFFYVTQMCNLYSQMELGWLLFGL